MRKLGLILWLGMAFTVVSALSLFWTVSLPLTLQRVITDAQLVGSMWLMREFARSEEQVHSLLVACCFGCFVPMANVLNNFVTGRSIGYDRFSSTGAVPLDPNDLGLTLALAMPMAWQLMRRRSGWVRLVLKLYFASCAVSDLAHRQSWSVCDWSDRPGDRPAYSAVVITAFGRRSVRRGDRNRRDDGTVRAGVDLGPAEHDSGGDQSTRRTLTEWPR